MFGLSQVGNSVEINTWYQTSPLQNIKSACGQKGGAENAASSPPWWPAPPPPPLPSPAHPGGWAGEAGEAGEGGMFVRGARLEGRGAENGVFCILL